jgi:hypothetical protein
LSCPCRQGLLAVAALRIAVLGGTQDPQKGQRPDTGSPGEGREYHTREPAPAPGFDHRRVRGPHGITVETFGDDLLAASAFDGGSKAKDDDTAGDAHRHEEPEEPPTGGARRPAGALQDTMIRRQVGGCTAPHKPENRCHRPLPRRQA